MVTARYVPNPALIPRLAVAPVVNAALASEAAGIAERARQLAPVETGALASSIEVDPSAGEARVVVNVPYAIFVEYGTSDTPAFAFLRGAAGSSGLRGA